MLNGCFVSYLILMFVGVIQSQTNTTHCFPQYDGSSQCYIRPSEPLNLSWSEAQQWCKNNGATLPILKNNIYYDDSNVIRNQYAYALRLFGLANQLVWIAIKSAQDPNNWKWIDGSTFTGTVETGDDVNNTYAYMIRLGANISFGADPPFERNLPAIQPYNCDRVVCSYSPTCLWKNGLCYTKSSSRETWYNSGQLIVIPESGLGDIEDWLDESTKYWIGLRCQSWYWQDAVTNKETELSRDDIMDIRVDATYEQCVAYQNEMYRFNRHCSTRLPFICQTPTDRNVTQATEPLNIRPASRTGPTVLSETSAESTTNIDQWIALVSTADIPNDTRTSATALKLDLLIGLGGCLLLLIIMWLIILTALYIGLYRRFMNSLRGHWGNLKESSVKFIHGEDKFGSGTGASNDAVEFQDSSECNKSNDKDCMNKPILQQA